MQAALWGLLLVLGYGAYVVFGGPLWRRTTLRALRRGGDDADARLAAQIMAPLPQGSADAHPRTQLDGALEILAIELERLLPMARDLAAIWWQVRLASMLSARGWGQATLDRYARFEAMALETLSRAEGAYRELDATSQRQLEDQLGDMRSWMRRVAAWVSQLGDAARIEARHRPSPQALLSALDAIGRCRQILRSSPRDPYR